MLSASFYTKIGLLSISEASGCLVSLKWEEKGPKVIPKTRSALLEEAQLQIEAFLEGGLSEFDLPICPSGSLFQREVYKNLNKILLGEITTYGDLANTLSTSPRAIGKACSSNPLPIIIPCHRVLAKSGLGGYSGPGGDKTKKFLLDLEADVLEKNTTLNRGGKNAKSNKSL